MKNLKILGIILFMVAAFPLYAGVNDIAKNSLLENVISLPQGEFLRAGANQFGSFWTRDFCFSVPALLTLNKNELVKNHLNFLIKNRRKDGLVPIYADSIHPMKRVISEAINRLLGTHIGYKINKNIKPYYSANGSYPTIDANIMVLKAAYDYYQESGDEIWWQENQDNFSEIYKYYNNLKNDELISQGEFSDWQDSAKRKGKTFFTNILYLDVSRSFQFLNTNQLDHLAQKIHDTFYDEKTGLYFSVQGHPYISLDGILWAIDKKLLPNTELLYERLKIHKLWTQYAYPGFNTYPSYPKNWLVSQVKLVGLGEYHSNLTWSWLMAFSARVAYEQGDYEEGKRISDGMKAMITRDKVVGEIYHSDNHYRPFWSKLYRSESPFSWGSAFVIQMLKTEEEVR
jgi:glycogen debranching enzyme